MRPIPSPTDMKPVPFEYLLPSKWEQKQDSILGAKYMNDGGNS